MRALVLLALLLTACETTWPEGATITSASGQRLCAKHHVPLVPLRVWKAGTPGGNRVYLVHDADHPYYGVAEQYCPNHIPEYVSADRIVIFQQPTTIYYCRTCEDEFRDRLRVSDEKAALTFAKYSLPFWSGGVQTKSPYQVSLSRDTWTVSCLLVDGRKATIRIGKESGRVLATHFAK